MSGGGHLGIGGLRERGTSGADGKCESVVVSLVGFVSQFVTFFEVGFRRDGGQALEVGSRGREAPPAGRGGSLLAGLVHGVVPWRGLLRQGGGRGRGEVVLRVLFVVVSQRPRDTDRRGRRCADLGVSRARPGALCSGRRAQVAAQVPRAGG